MKRNEPLRANRNGIYPTTGADLWSVPIAFGLQGERGPNGSGEMAQTPTVWLTSAGGEVRVERFTNPPADEQQRGEREREAVEAVQRELAGRGE